MSEYNKLINDINNGKLSPIYLIHGDESFFSDNLINTIINSSVKADAVDFDLKKIYSKKSDENQENEVVDFLKRYPLVGDFNLTPYAAHFHEIIEQIGWKDSRRGFGVANTWPSFLPAAFRIPIDHILFRGDLVVLDRQILDSNGSDHLPVMIKFSVKT